MTVTRRDGVVVLGEGMVNTAANRQDKTAFGILGQLMKGRVA